ncbi:MAG: hypothetical protein K5739_00245 [Lachnospiraceae bacterium]|nr:hypothetical protein [Lachnospiraceae bacterium]
MKIVIIRHAKVDFDWNGKSTSDVFDSDCIGLVKGDNMVILIESIVLCIAFTLMVYIMSRKPIQTLYNYPPKIQERVKSLDEYKDQIPTEKNKVAAKLIACILFVIVISLILRFINGYRTFLQAFGWGFLLWTVVNLYDAIVLDIIWFCHDPYFVFKGTEDMVDEYHNYWFHIKGFFIGEGLALVICALAGLVVQKIL